MTEQSRVSADLTGKVAIVTGASRGIGREIALTLARAGAKLACVANEELVTEVVAEIEAAGGEAVGWVSDVSDSADVKKVVGEIAEKFGGIDILVNNAGITRDNLLMRMTDEEWDLVLDVNLKGVFYFIRAAARSLRRSKSGRIINIASVSGIMGNAGQANYSASKAGVIGLTKTTAKELASKKITANAIAPGFIATDMTKGLPESVTTIVEEHTPLKRMGRADEIADAVLFLASESAAFITGQVLAVDGGLAM